MSKITTPGISYVDYVQDSIPWDGTGTKPKGVVYTSYTLTGTIESPFLTVDEMKLTQNNRLREKAMPDNATGSSSYAAFKLELDPADEAHDGYNNMAVGFVCLLNFLSLVRNPLSGKVEDRTNCVIQILIDGLQVHTVNLETSKPLSKNSRFPSDIYPIVLPTVYYCNEVEVRIVKPPGETRDQWYDIGRLWVGNFMPVCFDSDWSVASDNPSKINYSAGLDAHPVEQRRRRRASYSIENILQEQAYGNTYAYSYYVPRKPSFTEMMTQVGKDYPFIVTHRFVQHVRYDDDTVYSSPYCIFGLSAKDIQIQHVSGPLYQTQIDVVELI